MNLSKSGWEFRGHKISWEYEYCDHKDSVYQKDHVNGENNMADDDIDGLVEEELSRNDNSELSG